MQNTLSSSRAAAEDARVLIIDRIFRSDFAHLRDLLVFPYLQKPVELLPAIMESRAK